MNVRTASIAGLATATVLALVGCSSGTGFPSGNGGAPAGNCSDPNPSYLALTFAAVVCIDSASRVRQSDGSTELELRVSVTDKDPNAFGVTSWDFQVLDAHGHDIDADDPRMSGRTGTSTCVHQDFTDDGWPVQPGASFTIPGPLCFNLAGGTQPTRLVWQSDVSVAIPRP
jgi:hypothetical protein